MKSSKIREKQQNKRNRAKYKKKGKLDSGKDKVQTMS
jgi:hypothetical protein